MPSSGGAAVPAQHGPIGVFDSGVGGLTVLRALCAALPGERFVYLGDTARLPYGTKSSSTVARYSLQCAAALVARGIRALVVACNTASASSLEALGERYPSLPIIGVIEPGARAALAATRCRRIAVVATEGTIAGGAYQQAIRGLDPAVSLRTAACPLFVALAEEGWVDGEVARAVARRYLAPMFDTPDPPDTLLLGCTHFPVLEAALRAVLPDGVRVVDSAATTAAAAARLLGPPAGAGLPAAGPQERRVRWLATDGAARFARVGGIFLGEPLDPAAIEIVDL